MRHSRGFAIPELLTVIAVASILIGGLVTITGRVFTVSRFEFEQVRITEDGRKEMERISDALRNARSVDRNGDGNGEADNELWLQQAGPTSITVFTNSDDDAEAELVRYFVAASGTELHRGVIKSNGGTYNGLETVQPLLRSLRNGETNTPVFTYLPADSETTITGSLSAEQRRLVQRVGIALHIDVNPAQDPPAAHLRTLVTPRFGACGLAGCAGGAPPLGGPGDPGPDEPAPPPGAPPTVDLRVSYNNNPPAGGIVSVPHDSTITIFWVVTNNAANCWASELPFDETLGWSGSKDPRSGSHTIDRFSRTTSFYLTCMNGYGVGRDQVLVNIQPAGVDLRANGAADAITIPYNSPVTLSWNAVSVSSCIASGALPGWNGAKPLSGTQNMGNLTSSVTYQLRCFRSGGVSFTDTVTVTVSPPVDLKVNGADSISPVAYGTPLNFSWTSGNMASCTASGGWTGAKPTSGSETVVARSATYTLTCRTAQGTSHTDSVTVTLTAPTVILTASPTTVPPGGSTTLTSTISGAAACTASARPGNSQWLGSKNPAGGSQTITGINASTVFTLTCDNGAESTVGTVTVRLNPPTIDSFTATPKTINQGEASTLSWQSTNTTGCTISGVATPLPPSGSRSTGPLTQSRNYTLTCTGPGGSVSETTTVTVIEPAVTLRANGVTRRLTVAFGTEITLSWTTDRNRTTCFASSFPSLSQWSGEKNRLGGSQYIGVLPRGGHSFFLSCPGTGGTATSQVDVMVVR